MLPSGTAKWHRQSPNGDDRARWRGRKRKWHRQTSEEDVRARWKDKENENGQLLAPTFHRERRVATETSIPRSAFQMEAFCFHLERQNRTGSPPKGTTVPSGKPEDRSRTGSPPKATIVPGGKPETGKAQQKNRRTLQPGGPKTYCANPYIA